MSVFRRLDTTPAQGEFDYDAVVIYPWSYGTTGQGEKSIKNYKSNNKIERSVTFSAALSPTSTETCAPPSSSRSVVSNEYADWLGDVEWNSFITFTLESTSNQKRVMDFSHLENKVHKVIYQHTRALWNGYEQSGEACLHRSKVDEHTVGNFSRKWKNGKLKPNYIIALEPHKNGSPHAHVLIGHPAIEFAKWDFHLWRELWNRVRHGGIFKLEPIRNSQKVTKYITKYVTKSNGYPLAINIRPNLAEQNDAHGLPASTPF